jgi:hypothetical protein
MGRWMSPDWADKPEAVPYSSVGDPQSLNLYSYVGNNPLSKVDADGHDGGGFIGNPKTYPGFNAFDEFVAASRNGGRRTTGGAALLANTVAQQQRYDPSKSGPEDPTNPGHPLSQNSVVKKASDQAFITTNNGTARGGLAEAGFSIDYSDGKISIANKVNSVNGDGTPNQLQITTDGNTIAILHTHGNNALPTPSAGDRNPNAQVPDFVRSRSALYVTVPHSAIGSPSLNEYIQLQ